MVCLNDVISFKKNILKNNLKNELNDYIQNNFYLNEIPQLKLESNIKSELTIKIIDNIKNLIKNKINELFENDYFLYKNMDDNVCTHKYKRGKNDGRFCCKKITKKGNKEKYVCRIHNPDHKPEKRNNKKLKNSKNNKNCKIFENNKNIDNSTIKINNSKNKILKRKKHIKKKMIIHGIINFKDIFNKLLS